jgi:hypothetical protein
MNQGGIYLRKDASHAHASCVQPACRAKPGQGCYSGSASWRDYVSSIAYTLEPHIHADGQSCTYLPRSVCHNQGSHISFFMTDRPSILPLNSTYQGIQQGISGRSLPREEDGAKKKTYIFNSLGRKCRRREEQTEERINSMLNFK